jgi:hypothetical protein
MSSMIDKYFSLLFLCSDREKVEDTIKQLRYIHHCLTSEVLNSPSISEIKQSLSDIYHLNKYPVIVIDNELKITNPNRYEVVILSNNLFIDIINTFPKGGIVVLNEPFNPSYQRFLFEEVLLRHSSITSWELCNCNLADGIRNSCEQYIELHCTDKPIERE